nr:immunoglobulin light chain junction region [Macaca mulatta]
CQHHDNSPMFSF